MYAFWLSLGTVFAAEMGDKTQLVALCLASRFNAKTVLAGILSATLLVHVFSVLLGSGVGRLLPEDWIRLAAGIAFIGFGLWTLRGDSLSDEECDAMQGRSPFWLVASTFFLAELGDKTMLATVTLATDNSLIPVWIGSSLGMVVADGLAILVGKGLGAKLPERLVKIGAAVIFFAFGAFRAVEGAMKLPSYAWLAAVLIVALFIGIFVRGQRQEKLAAITALDEPAPVSDREDVEVTVG